MPVNYTVIVIGIRDFVVHSAAAIQCVDAVVLRDVCVGSVCRKQMKSAAHICISCGSAIVVTVVFGDREITGNIAGFIYITELIVFHYSKVAKVLVCVSGITILRICRSIVCLIDLLILYRNNNCAGLIDQAFHFAALQAVCDLYIIAFEGADISVGRPNDNISCRIFQAILSVLIIGNNVF